jgi:GR25 family glycosyltransferase involved in LPS biosynthesis
MNAAIGIVAHKDRLEQATELVEKVNAVEWNVDDGTLGCNGNHLTVLKMLRRNNPGKEWYVVLEDDAQPVDDFEAQLAMALKAAPTQVVSLYLGTSNPIHWQDAIARAVSCAEAWIVGTHLLHAVGYCVNAAIIDTLIDHIEPNSPRPIDEQISQWVYPHHVFVGYTCPSLVDHADGEPIIQKRLDGAPRVNPRKAWKVGTRSNWRSKSVLLS